MKIHAVIATDLRPAQARRKSAATARAGLLALTAALVTTSASAQSIDAAVDSFFKNYLGWFADLIFTSVPLGGTAFPLIAGWLLLAALIFTLYFGFLQFRKFKLATDIVRGRYSDPHHKEPGEISHFQALPRRCRARWAWATSPGSARRSP